MEHSKKNTFPERDISPDMMGRQEQFGNGWEEQGSASAPSCPWINRCEHGWGLTEHPLAMVYAPCQDFHSLYDPETALMRGTLFSELDLPLEVISDKGVSACSGCRLGNRYHLN